MIFVPVPSSLNSNLAMEYFPFSQPLERHACTMREISSLPGPPPEAKAFALSPRPDKNEVNVRENCLRLKSWEFTGSSPFDAWISELKPLKNKRLHLFNNIVYYSFVQERADCCQALRMRKLQASSVSLT